MNRHTPPCRIGLVYGPQLDVGGVETHLLQLLKYLDRDRFEPILFSNASARFTRRVKLLGSEVIPWKPDNALDFRSAQHIKELFRENAIDLAHIHHPRAYWPASRAAHSLKIPCAATVHLSAHQMAGPPGTLHRVKAWAYATAEDWLLRRRIDRVVFVSEHTRSRMNPIPHAVTIPNGIDPQPNPQPETRETLRAGMRIPEGCMVLIAVGRLHTQKGYDILLEALARLKPAPESLQLWIAGEGEERAALEAQTHALNLQENLLFLGAREDIPDLLRAADIFVLPSRFEGMPYILLEAMAAGTAIIASEVGEVGSLIENNRNGMLVPAGNPVLLAERIHTLCHSPQTGAALGTSAKAKVSGYEARPLVQRLAAIYSALLPSDAAAAGGAQHG